MRPITPESRIQTYVLYGESGGGKTTLAATAPRPAFLDTNKGTLSLAGRKGFEHVQSEEMDEFKDLERALANFKGTGKKAWKGKFDTIVFDHFDDVQAIVMEELGRKRNARDERKDIDEAEQRDWGLMAMRLKRILRGFKTVPIHKILICGEKTSTETGLLTPSLQGQLQNQLPYFADHVMYLRVGKKGKRFLHLDPTDEFFAKTRAWWLPPELRKMAIDFDDTKMLTNLFAAIAAGPKGTSRGAPKGK